MKAIFDTATNRLTVNGRRSRNRRQWLVKVEATTTQGAKHDELEISEPCLAHELPAIIEAELFYPEGGLIRVRWEAMAR